MCTIKNYRFIISALGSAYINDYEKYTTEAFYHKQNVQYNRKDHNKHNNLPF